MRDQETSRSPPNVEFLGHNTGPLYWRALGLNERVHLGQRLPFSEYYDVFYPRQSTTMTAVRAKLHRLGAACYTRLCTASGSGVHHGTNQTGR